MKKLFEKLFGTRAERQEKYIKKIDIEKEPLTVKQFDKLRRKKILHDRKYIPWINEWAEKSKEREEREEQEVRGFLQKAVEAFRHLVLREEWQEIADRSSFRDEPAPAPVPAKQRPPKKMPLFLSIAVACALCLVVALPLVINGLDGVNIPKNDTGRNTPGQNTPGSDDPGSNDPGIYFPGWEFDGNNVVFRGGVFLPDLFAEVNEAENLLIFKGIVPDAGQVRVDERVDTGEALSYRFYEIIVDASTSTEIIVFVITFRIRFDERFVFIGYESNYKTLTDSFTIGETEISYNISACSHRGSNIARLRFKYLGNDYFLEVSQFEIEGIGPTTEVTEATLKTLMQNLFSA
jgi:hypothetical protein